MHIWVDGDACPQVIRQIIFRASERTGVPTTIVANHAIPVPPTKHIQCLQVSKGFDEADNEIVKRCNEHDIVITADIPLAADVIDKKAHAISPRGEEFTKSDIRQKLNMRDFMDTMRSSGVQMSGGPAPMSQRDKQQFANALDRLLAQR